MVDLKIKIGEERYALPSYVTIQKFQELTGFDLDNPAHDIYICSILLEVPIKTLKEADPLEIVWLKTALLQPLAGIENASITAQISGFSLLNFDKTTIGQFADLDVLLTEGLGQNMAQIVSILYNAPVETVLEWNVKDVYASLLQWNSYRENIYKAYKNLFDINEGGSGDEDSGPNDAKHAWYTLLMTLCNDRFLDLEHVTGRPLIEALNYLAYMKQKNLRLKAQMEKGMKKLK